MISIFVLAVIVFASSQIIKISTKGKRKQPYGVALIEIERKEQLGKHNISIASDMDLNSEGELINAALFVLSSNIGHYPAIWDGVFAEKIKQKTYKEKLVIAGALIAAEIDRVHAIMSEGE